MVRNRLEGSISDTLVRVPLLLPCRRMSSQSAGRAAPKPRVRRLRKALGSMIRMAPGVAACNLPATTASLDQIFRGAHFFSHSFSTINATAIC